MTSQIRRAAYSVMANIAEGNERRGARERINFFMIAKGSLVEVDCFLELSHELQYLSLHDYTLLENQLNKVASLLNHFIISQPSPSL